MEMGYSQFYLCSYSIPILWHSNVSRLNFPKKPIYIYHFQCRAVILREPYRPHTSEWSNLSRLGEARAHIWTHHSAMCGYLTCNEEYVPHVLYPFSFGSECSSVRILWTRSKDAVPAFLYCISWPSCLYHNHGARLAGLRQYSFPGTLRAPFWRVCGLKSR